MIKITKRLFDYSDEFNPDMIFSRAAIRNIHYNFITKPENIEIRIYPTNGDYTDIPIGHVGSMRIDEGGIIGEVMINNISKGNHFLEFKDDYVLRISFVTRKADIIETKGVKYRIIDECEVFAMGAYLKKDTEKTKIMLDN